MSKRHREDPVQDEEPLHKRIKAVHIDRLSKLSDEMVLRVLSFLPVSQLAMCERLSHKYKALARDGQLWKGLYFNRFVRPRVSRLPGLKEGAGTEQSRDYTSGASRWLDEDRLVARGARTNWKKQYRLRNNWSKGTCAVEEIEVTKLAPTPPVIVQMHQGVIYIVDVTEGLRAWSARGERSLIAETPLSTLPAISPPTSLAVHMSSDEAATPRVIVGFENGSFGVYSLHRAEGRFFPEYTHDPSTSGVISAVALSWPYAVTMTATQLLSLYRFPVAASDRQDESRDPPRLLHSLRSLTVWPPLAASLRVSDSNITVSVAYALPTYLSGWTVGIQEIVVSVDGNLVSSRLAYAIEQHYRPLALSCPPLVTHLPTISTPSNASSANLEVRHIHSKPTSLSYTHPYLLVSHPDNTLTLYLVTSTTDSLSISAGNRLWGHTSSVSGAHVGDRGKAVSVSRRGDEVRVWELEGGFASSTARKRLAGGDLSVRVRSEAPRDGDGHPPRSKVGRTNAANNNEARADCLPATSCAFEASDLTLTRGWIGFDDEVVMVLREHGHGRQALVVYDFT